METLQYCLLTACRNEAKLIPKAIKAMVQQSHKPGLWLILDDGSTDGTPEIVEEMAGGHEWIQVKRLDPRKERSFGAQYRAIMGGYEQIRALPFDFIGVLDADISFENTGYYQTIMDEFRNNPKLGIAGGAIYEKKHDIFKYRRSNVEWSVAGGVQTFRRKTFEDIGGYIPLEYGGSDGLAVLMAKMKGWEVRSLSQLQALHHRPSTTADGAMRGAFRTGIMDAALGYHPLFMAFKCIHRLPLRPVVFGAMLSFTGYWYYKLKGYRPVIPNEVINYLRETQFRRMSSAIRLKGANLPGL